MCTMSNFICQWLYLLFWLDYYYLFGASLQFAAVVHHSATASISYFCRPRLPTSPKTKLRPPWMMKKLPILWFPHLNSVLLFTDPGQVIPMYHHYPIGLFLGRIQTPCNQRTSFYSVSYFSIWKFMSKWFSDLFISNFDMWNH